MSDRALEHHLARARTILAESTADPLVPPVLSLLGFEQSGLSRAEDEVVRLEVWDWLRDRGVPTDTLVTAVAEHAPEVIAPCLRHIARDRPADRSSALAAALRALPGGSAALHYVVWTIWKEEPDESLRDAALERWMEVPPATLSRADLREIGKHAVRVGVPILQGMNSDELGARLRPCEWSGTEDPQNLRSLWAAPSERVVEFLASAHSPLRDLAVDMADVAIPAERDALLAALSRAGDESHAQRLCYKLARSGVAWVSALAASPVAGPVAHAMGEQGSWLPPGEPALDSAYVDGAIQRTLQSLECVAETRHRRWLGGRPDDSDVGRHVADLAALIAERRPTVRLPPGPVVPPRVLTQVGEALGLRAVDPVWLERHDAPRIDYLHAVSRSRRGRTSRAVEHALGSPWEQLLAWERDVDERRARLGRARAALVGASRERARALAPSEQRSHSESTERREELRRIVPELSPVELDVAVTARPEEAAEVVLLHRAWRAALDGPEGAFRLTPERKRSLVDALPPDLPLDSEGLLGSYHPLDRRVSLYDGMRPVAARFLGCSEERVEELALLHEAAHALLVHGADPDADGWQGHAASSAALHEMLAAAAVVAAVRAGAELALLDPAERLVAGGLGPVRAALLAETGQGELRNLARLARADRLRGRDDEWEALRRWLVPPDGSGALDAVVRGACSGLDEELLRASLWRWLGRGPAVGDGALPLRTDWIEEALKRSGPPAAPGLGKGLWPLLLSAPDFLAAIATPTPLQASPTSGAPSGQGRPT